MPFAIVIAIVQISFVVHAAKTGRFTPWGWIILLLPVVGVLAYIVVELVPEWLGSPRGQRARQRVVDKLGPEREYRKLTDDLAIADTIANRTALAAECLVLGKFAEARGHYADVLGRSMGDEPTYALGKAQAEFGLSQPQRAIETLDQLRARWPDYQSAEGHLLYARALEGSGRTDEALDEYRALADYYSGAEARVRWAMLLQRLGRDGEAKRLYSDVLAQMRRAPKYVRAAQADWIAAAEKGLRG
jgi:hypothetical protein